MVKFIEDENERENADGVKGILISVGKSNPNKSIYDKYVKRGIDKAVEISINKIKDLSHNVSTKEEIAQVAGISAGTRSRLLLYCTAEADALRG